MLDPRTCPVERESNLTLHRALALAWAWHRACPWQPEARTSTFRLLTSDPMITTTKARSLFDPPIVRRALLDSVLKLNPRRQVRNPVMFTVFVGSILTTWLGMQALSATGQ